MRPMNLRASLLLLLSFPAWSAMTTNNGCQTIAPTNLQASANSELAGIWALSRGAVKLHLMWGANSESNVEPGTQSLQPLDASAYPAELAPFIQQWNDGLADLNDSLEKVFPASVLCSFPHYGVVRFVDAANPTRVAEGGIDNNGKYILVGDLSGASAGDSQGGGSYLDASSIQGSFDRSALTTQGFAARSLTVYASVVGGGSIGLKAQISIDFTGLRTGDLPGGG